MLCIRVKGENIKTTNKQFTQNRHHEPKKSCHRRQHSDAKELL